MYTIVTGLKSDWLQYANHNTILQKLTLAPDKKTIESFLNDLWFKSWDDIAGHAQTKYWLPRPDSFLATKLLTMSRKHLGFNIQFFSGHGWWRKHLTTPKLSKSLKCDFQQRFTAMPWPSPCLFMCLLDAKVDVRQK